VVAIERSLPIHGPLPAALLSVHRIIPFAF
jgi:hypothetical protein